MNQEQYDDEMYGRQVTGDPEVHWYGSGWAMVALIGFVAYLVW